MTPDKIIQLPNPIVEGSMSVEEAIAKRRSVRTFAAGGLETAQIGQMLWSAQGITQKTTGHRASPSAGATYPLEVYVAALRVSGLEPGLYKYLPKNHTLALVKEGELGKPLAAAAMGQGMVSSAPASFIIAAEYGRTAGRYGDRAPRYVHMEAGHAAQNLTMQAVSMGLGSVLVGAFDDKGVSAVLGLPGQEEPLYIIPVGIQR